ncbi:eCIS core domain-containing protein [Flavobacterium panacagri]|uniref:eCIS core domain-containing protein n=1 Tax=Flavobacterium panacagri TaxID=3034146 RepID=UPI0025A5D6C4|nr:DUF4157 domain-containing protein [Flavobacterium panacagri]
MTEDHQKISENKIQVSAANVNHGNSSVELKDNRSHSIIQQKLAEKTTSQKAASSSITIQRKSNDTGLSDNLKSGIENLSGHSMDDVKVHYNSDKPALINAHAYAQGTDIHIANGQEKHLAHEAWHVVQQKQGRVKPTLQMNGKTNVNDDKSLEKEADIMGAKASQMTKIQNTANLSLNSINEKTLQLKSKNKDKKKEKAIAYQERQDQKAGIREYGREGYELKVINGEENVFTKFPPNKEIDPNIIGEHEGGIRVDVAESKPSKSKDKAIAYHEKQERKAGIREYGREGYDLRVINGEERDITPINIAETRPDDVPLLQKFRIETHSLHNIMLIFKHTPIESKQGQSISAETINIKLIEIQSEAKKLAKNYKTDMRDLRSVKRVKKLRDKYTLGMEVLTRKLIVMREEAYKELPQNIKKSGSKNLDINGTEIWRKDWLKTKTAIDNALGNLWGRWQTKLKVRARKNYGLLSKPVALNRAKWNKQVANEKWSIYYGGSLAKGYKGPPKQNTRFLASNFDVDANMDAPSISEYLINKKGKKVDRGQLDPKGADTDIENMDIAMDKEVKNELIKSKMVPDMESVNQIITEQFETRVNASKGLSDEVTQEVQRGENEQNVRDKLTGIRKTNPKKMKEIGKRLQNQNLLKDNSLDPRVLTEDEIKLVDQIIQEVISSRTK